MLRPPRLPQTIRLRFCRTWGSWYYICNAVLIVVLLLDFLAYPPHGLFPLSLFQEQITYSNEPCGWDYLGSSSIGVLSGTSPTELAFDPITNRRHNPILSCMSVSDDNASFVSQPFLVVPHNMVQGSQHADAFPNPRHWYTFFRVQNLGRSPPSGEVGVAQSTDGGVVWKYLGTALSEAFGLGYPLVTFHKQTGHFVMIPDAETQECVRVYETDVKSFPYDWLLAHEVLHGPGWANVSPLYFEGMWWIWTTQRATSSTHLFYAADLFQEWTEHPMSPIHVHNGVYGSSTGRPVVDQGNVYRFVQDCAVFCGEGVRVLAVTSLSLTSYQEIMVHSISPGKGSSAWNSHRVSHVDAHYHADSGEFRAVAEGDRIPPDFHWYRREGWFRSLKLTLLVVIITQLVVVHATLFVVFSDKGLQHQQCRHAHEIPSAKDALVMPKRTASDEFFAAAAHGAVPDYALGPAHSGENYPRRRHLSDAVPEPVHTGAVPSSVHQHGHLSPQLEPALGPLILPFPSRVCRRASEMCEDVNAMGWALLSLRSARWITGIVFLLSLLIPFVLFAFEPWRFHLLFCPVGMDGGDVQYRVPSSSSQLPNFAVATAASANYYERLENLVGSIHFWEPGQRIIVFDMGLTEEQALRVSCWENVELRLFDFARYPRHIQNIYTYAWKPLLISEALSANTSVLYLDSGVELRKPLHQVKAFLKRDGYFNVKQSNFVGLKTHKRTMKAMGVQDRSFNDQPFCSGGLQGYLHGGRAHHQILDKAVKCALNEDCIAPDGSGRENHNYDQSVFSMLIYRNNFTCQGRNVYAQEDLQSDNACSALVGDVSLPA